MTRLRPTVEIFIDGACRGNPGPGGWGVLLRYKMHQRLLYGAEPHTTNNRMELMAAIMALKKLKQPCQVIISTDSLYVKKGITEWLATWEKRGWHTASKKSVKNSELWKLLALEAKRHQIEWHWIKGHSGHLENEQVDKLANQAIDTLLA